MAESILINGEVYDFYSTRLNIYGLPIVGYTSVDYSDKIERGEGRGASQVALASSRGKYSADKFKVTVHRTTGEEMRQHIASQSDDGRSIGNVKGTIVLQLDHPVLGVQTVTAKDCKPDVPGTGSAKEGSDPLTEDWEFYTRLIDRNGITLYDSSEVGE